MEDTDAESLYQAADIVAYTYFGKVLYNYRGASDDREANRLDEIQRALGDVKVPRLNIPLWLTRKLKSNDGNLRALRLAAAYMLAYHVLQDYAPAFVNRYLKSPDEFLLDCKAHAHYFSPPYAGTSFLYLPILKEGVLEDWEAEKAKNAHKAAP